MAKRQLFQNPMLLANLKRISKDDLTTLLQTSWQLRAPKNLGKQPLSPTGRVAQ